MGNIPKSYSCQIDISAPWEITDKTNQGFWMIMKCQSYPVMPPVSFSEKRRWGEEEEKYESVNKLTSPNSNTHLNSLSREYDFQLDRSPYQATHTLHICRRPTLRKCWTLFHITFWHGVPSRERWVLKGHSVITAKCKIIDFGCSCNHRASSCRAPVRFQGL